MDFKKQVVLVTGAGQGIGAAIARAFAAEGSYVLVNDLHGANAEQVAQSIISTGGQARSFAADISDRAAVEKMFEYAHLHTGGITTLVNNAGYVPYAPFMEYPIETWHKTLNIDLGGVFHCTQCAVPQMLHQGWGAVVNIASVHASATLKETAAYAAAKAGVVSLTRTLALELGPKNIRVNCVSPGAIETDALKALFDSMPEEKREAERNHLLSWQACGRLGKPEDIANVVIFLCSEKAEFIAGTEIVADGGLLARLF